VIITLTIIIIILKKLFINKVLVQESKCQLKSQRREYTITLIIIIIIIIIINENYLNLVTNRWIKIGTNDIWHTS
jgi:hypothetical protein